MDKNSNSIKSIKVLRPEKSTYRLALDERVTKAIEKRNQTPVKITKEDFANW